jgi:hypothetical protein
MPTKMIGSREEVWHGQAKKTVGGLTKAGLVKRGPRSFASKKKVAAGHRALKHLRAAGYVVKRGQKPLLGKRKRVSK